MRGGGARSKTTLGTWPLLPERVQTTRSPLWPARRGRERLQRDVQWRVLALPRLGEAIDQAEVHWIDVISPLKFAVSNWIKLQWSTAKSLEPNELSSVLMIGRTRILWSLEGFRPLINIVALQLINLVWNQKQEEALTRSDQLSWKWSWQGYLVIWECHKTFMPFGQAKMVLPSYSTSLDRNLGKSWGEMDRWNKPKIGGERLNR